MFLTRIKIWGLRATGLACLFLFLTPLGGSWRAAFVLSGVVCLGWGSAIARRHRPVPGGPRPAPREIALSVFEEIQTRFPGLEMSLDMSPVHVDVTLDIPKQEGMEFPIHLNLQNQDELHLNAGEHFWVEWFPCTTAGVEEAFRAAIVGLIDGTNRILEERTATLYLRGFLQEPSGDGWRTIHRHYHQFALPGAGKHSVILQNMRQASIAPANKPLQPTSGGQVEVE